MHAPTERHNNLAPERLSASSVAAVRSLKDPRFSLPEFSGQCLPDGNKASRSVLLVLR
jgi:hypothetical protein